jgi:phi LC3 family holin
MNLQTRIKNYVFWFSLVAVFFSATGINPETLTSWTKLINVLNAFLMNPYQIGLFIVGVLGVINNPTTKNNGLKDD